LPAPRAIPAHGRRSPAADRFVDLQYLRAAGSSQTAALRDFDPAYDRNGS
jgi:hypothetical protein